VRPLNECARSYEGALDLTRAETCTICVTCSCAQGRTATVHSLRINVHSIALVEECVCELGFCAQANMSELECIVQKF
jgi:hypothetical protein